MAKRKHVAVETPAAGLDRIAELKELYPEAFSEGAVDFDKLRAALGDIADDKPERYSFTWAGKREAIRILQMPSRATLKPAKAESVDFDTTGNVFIEGDNLEALKLLFKPYFGRVKMIYTDPPYNTGNDFVYPDNYTDPLDTYLKITGQKDAEGNNLTTNLESNGRFHSVWLSMMYPRLFLARQLLAEDGAIFISIDEKEVQNLRALCNEVFGEECFVAVISLLCNPKGRSQDKYFATNHEYVVVYSKKPLPKGAFAVAKGEEQINAEYTEEDDGGKFRLLELRNTHREFGRHNRKNLYYPFFVDQTGAVSLESADGRERVLPNWEDGFEGCWTWDQHKAQRDIDYLVGQRIKGRWKIFRKSYASGADRMLKTILTDRAFHTECGQKEFNALFDAKGKLFQSPKSPQLIAELLRTTSKGSDVILDFFAGSCTTAQAVLELNREDSGNRYFIMVQLPEPTPEDSIACKAGFSTIAAIGKERIRRVIARLRKDRGDKSLMKGGKMPEDLGFRVYKLAESNYRQWKGVESKDPDAYVKEMGLFLDPLIPGWKPEDVLWEVAVKEGYGLGSRIEKEKDAEGLAVWRVTDPDKGQSFRLCLDDKVKLPAVKKLGLKKDDLFICRDKALDDETAANLALQCRLKTI